MTWDDAVLDVHADAIGAASAVRKQYWPEGTSPPDPELLAARMGIEVVVGRPDGDAAVTAGRDQQGARVVLAATLHPSVRSTLLLRAIGHLSRPEPPSAPDHVTDAFTASFSAALRVPEESLDTLRREGLTWPEIDDHLGAGRGEALKQWRVYFGLRTRHVLAQRGVTRPPADWS